MSTFNQSYVYLQSQAKMWMLTEVTKTIEINKKDLELCCLLSSFLKVIG